MRLCDHANVVRIMLNAIVWPCEYLNRLSAFLKSWYSVWNFDLSNPWIRWHGIKRVYILKHMRCCIHEISSSRDIKTEITNNCIRNCQYYLPLKTVNELVSGINKQVCCYEWMSKENIQFDACMSPLPTYKKTQSRRGAENNASIRELIQRDL